MPSRRRHVYVAWHGNDVKGDDGEAARAGVARAVVRRRRDVSGGNRRRGPSRPAPAAAAACVSSRPAENRLLPALPVGDAADQPRRLRAALERWRPELSAARASARVGHQRLPDDEHVDRRIGQSRGRLRGKPTARCSSRISPPRRPTHRRLAGGSPEARRKHPRVAFAPDGACCSSGPKAPRGTRADRWPGSSTTRPARRPVRPVRALVCRHGASAPWPRAPVVFSSCTDRSLSLSGVQICLVAASVSVRSRRPRLRQRRQRAAPQDSCAAARRAVGAAVQRQGPDQLGRGRQGEVDRRGRRDPRPGRHQRLRLPADREEIQGLLAVAPVQVRSRRQQRRLHPHRVQGRHGRRQPGQAVRDRPHAQSPHRRAVWRRPRLVSRGRRRNSSR